MSYKFETQYTSGNSTPFAQVARVFGIARVISGFTEHWWGTPDTGMTYEGVINWLCRPGGNTSAHAVVDGPSRRVACIVDFMDAAWAGGTAVANATQIHIENNCNTAAKASTTDVTAEFLADLRDPACFGDQLLYGHNYWIGTQCPGHFDIDEIDRLSYTKKPGKNFGEVSNIINTPPVTPAPVEAEWVRNVKDITDEKYSVVPAAGTYVYDLNTLQPIPNTLIPRGTQVDIAKETTIGGKKFYISSYAANNLKANGIPAENLAVPAVPPAEEKPEWLKNLQDIADKDMWTRSATPVLQLADGKTTQVLPINSRVRVIKSTTVLGQNLLVLSGEKTCIETIYLSDTPISNPDSDLIKENNTLLKAISAALNSLIEFVKSIFKGGN